MHITIYQLLTPIFAITMLLKGVSQLRRSTISVPKFIFWSILWSGISLLALYPRFVEVVAEFTGLESGINALIFFGFIFLFYLVFKIFSSLENLEREITQIVRKKALEDFSKNNLD